MPILAAAAIIQLAAACSGDVPPARVVAHAQVESSFQTTALHDNATGRSYVPASAAEAVALAKALLAQGHRIDAGVMQVTDANWAALGLTVETAFDPQRNVCAGRAVIAEAYAAERRVSCRYNTGKPECGSTYPARIEAAMRQAVAFDVYTPQPPPAPDDLPGRLVDTVIHKRN